MTTLKDQIRDAVKDYDDDTRNGEPSDPDVLATAIMEILREYMMNDLFDDTKV